MGFSSFLDLIAFLGVYFVDLWIGMISIFWRLKGK